MTALTTDASDDGDDSKFPEMLPAEAMVLTIVRSQCACSVNPDINMTSMLVATIDRLTGVRDWSKL